MQTLQKHFVEVEKLREINSRSDLKKILLDNRGYANQLDNAAFWNPSIDDLHDPFLFPQMENAVARILSARDNNERIVIFWDYDVDGVSSTALLLRFFTMLGIAVSYRIPHRIQDGYGMKSYFFDELAEKNVKLVISVDCGTRDIAAIRHAKSLGIDVIVTDHHAVPDSIPEEAVALISPKLRDTTYPFHGLSGSWVAFKLVSAVALRIYGDSQEYREILTSFIDLASLGTVADMMPLTDENRTIVQLWLRQMPFSRSPGLRKLIAGKSVTNADIIGFHIGPRINAAGRMASAETALKTLICSEVQTDELLSEIESLNEERKGSTQYFMQLALETVNPHQTPIIFESNDIHHGIMGLVAGRLAEHFGKPAIACIYQDGKYVGSARSPSEYHITHAFERISECFVAFGGHAQAAGFTILEERFEEFKTKITTDAENVFGKEQGKREKIQYIDGILQIDILNIPFVRELESIGPFGMWFRKPAFIIRFDQLPKWEFMWSGDLHIRFEAPNGIKMVAFWLWPMMHELDPNETNVGFVVEVDRETWQRNESVAVFVRDIIRNMK